MQNKNINFLFNAKSYKKKKKFTVVSLSQNKGINWPKQRILEVIVTREKGESLIFLLCSQNYCITYWTYIYTCSWDPQYSKKIKGNGKITVQYLTLPLKLEHICHMHQVSYKCI